MLICYTLDGIQHINVPKSQISYTVSLTVVAPNLCGEAVCMAWMNVHCPVIHFIGTCAHVLSTGKTCPHVNAFCEICKKLC